MPADRQGRKGRDWLRGRGGLGSRGGERMRLRPGRRGARGAPGPRSLSTGGGAQLGLLQQRREGRAAPLLQLFKHGTRLPTPGEPGQGAWNTEREGAAAGPRPHLGARGGNASHAPARHVFLGKHCARWRGPGPGRRRRSPRPGLVVTVVTPAPGSPPGSQAHPRRPLPTAPPRGLRPSPAPRSAAPPRPGAEPSRRLETWAPRGWALPRPGRSPDAPPESALRPPRAPTPRGGKRTWECQARHRARTPNPAGPASGASRDRTAWGLAPHGACTGAQGAGTSWDPGPDGAAVRRLLGGPSSAAVAGNRSASEAGGSPWPWVSRSPAAPSASVEARPLARCPGAPAPGLCGHARLRGASPPAARAASGLQSRHVRL